MHSNLYENGKANYLWRWCDCARILVFPQISLFALNVTKATTTATLARVAHPASDFLNRTLAVDLACQKEAMLAGLSGSFVALVSTPSRSLKQLLHYQYRDNMPIINTKVLSLRICSQVGLHAYLSYFDMILYIVQDLIKAINFELAVVHGL